MVVTMATWGGGAGGGTCLVLVCTLGERGQHSVDRGSSAQSTVAPFFFLAPSYLLRPFISVTPPSGAPVSVSVPCVTGVRIVALLPTRILECWPP